MTKIVTLFKSMSKAEVVEATGRNLYSVGNDFVFLTTQEGSSYPPAPVPDNFMFLKLRFHENDNVALDKLNSYLESNLSNVCDSTYSKFSNRTIPEVGDFCLMIEDTSDLQYENIYKVMSITDGVYEIANGESVKRVGEESLLKVTLSLAAEDSQTSINIV